MILSKFVSGVNTSFSSELNSNFAVSLRSNGLNLIRMLEDKVISFSSDGGEWAEAYTDSNGRLDSVDTNETTAIFDSNKFEALKMSSIDTNVDTIYNPDNVNNEDNFFDESSSTSANISWSGTDGGTSILGILFDEGSTLINKIRIHARSRAAVSGASGTTSARIELYINDGVDWVFHSTLDSDSNVNSSSTAEYNDEYDLNLSVYGIAVRCVATRPTAWNTFSRHHNYYRMDSIKSVGEVEVYHNVESGTFSNTTSSCIGIPKLKEWESGSSVQYKLTNTTEDTGWLNANEVSTFTAFTSEPTQCIVKLIPKSTSPSPGYPSISGFALYGDKKE